MQSPWILALGSSQGDDRIAWTVADLLARDERLRERIVWLKTPWDIPGHLPVQGETIVLDACCSGAPPGTIQRWSAMDLPELAAANRSSTHGGNVAQALRLAETLGHNLSDVSVYAVEIQACDTGSELSPPVRAAVQKLTQLVLESLDSSSDR